MEKSDKNISLSGNLHPIGAFFLIILFVFVGLLVGQFFGFALIVPIIGLDMTAISDFSENMMRDDAYRLPLFILQGATAFTAFVLAPILYLKFIAGISVSVLFNTKRALLIPLLLTIFITISFIAVNAIFIEWNANLEFPDYLKGFEHWARNAEDQAQALTMFLLDFQSPVLFLLAIIVVAILPALGEELVFRGLLQNQLKTLTGNAHIAIWIAAILFSAIHVQFFGFIPRLLLGALFGYLYYWSGSLWMPVIAHFVNNGLTLALVYAGQLSWIEYDMQEVAPLSWTNILPLAFIFVLLIYYFHRHLKTQKVDDNATFLS